MNKYTISVVWTRSGRITKKEVIAKSLYDAFDKLVEKYGDRVWQFVDWSYDF